MLEQIYADLEQLTELCGMELLEKNTAATVALLAPLSSLAEDKEPDGAEKQQLVKTLLEDLVQLQKTQGLPQQKVEAIQKIVARYEQMLNPISLKPQQTLTAAPTPTPLTHEPKIPKKEVHPQSVYPAAMTRGSVAGSSASRLSMASAARSTFFRGQAATVMTNTVLEEQLRKICKSNESRVKIVNTIRSQLKRYKNDSSRYKDAINHLEAFIVLLLVRTDLPLADLYKAKYDSLFALTKTQLGLNKLLIDISALVTAGPEKCFRSDAACYQLLKEILPAIVTTSKDNPVSLYIKNAIALTIVPDINKEASLSLEASS